MIKSILENHIDHKKAGKNYHALYDTIMCFYEFITENLGKLCKQEYSQHVVEKAVEIMPRKQIERICEVFMDKRGQNKKHKFFKDILLDPYGNYIA